MVTTCPPFGTRGILTFDFSIAPYTNLCYIFYSLITLQVIRGLGNAGGADPTVHQPSETKQPGLSVPPPFITTRVTARSLQSRSRLTV